MTAHTPLQSPTTPSPRSYGPENSPQGIRIVLDGMTGTNPTAMAARSTGPEGRRPH